VTCDLKAAPEEMEETLKLICDMKIESGERVGNVKRNPEGNI
jgi:hypothetical protein